MAPINTNITATHEGEKTRHRSAYSTKRKYSIVQEMNGGATKTQILAKYPNLQRRTLDNWLRRKDEIIQVQESGLRSKKKRNFNDPLKRVKQRVMDFLNANEQLNDSERMVLTGEMIGIKAKMIADELLQEQRRQPFLSTIELEGLTKFTGSGAWGRKFCRDIRYRTANAPPLDSDEESTTEFAMVDLADSEPAVQDPDVLKRGEVKARHITGFVKAAEKMAEIMAKDADFFEDGEALRDYIRRLERKKRRVGEELKNKSLPRFSVLQQLDYSFPNPSIDSIPHSHPPAGVVPAMEAFPPSPNRFQM
jgi:hypothetical protein